MNRLNTRTERTPVSCRQGVACLCAGVSFAELDEAIAADGEATLQSLGESLGCGIQCGSCVPALREALGEEAWFAATATCRPVTKSGDRLGQERLIYKVDVTLHEDHAYPNVQPGQHVVLRAHVAEAVVERTYTVIGQDQAARKLTLGIRRKPEGRLTPWLLDPPDAPAARAVEVSAPGGPGLRSGGSKSVVFFAGGVGITPAVAMVNALSSQASMHLDYSVKDADDAAFLANFEARRKDRPGFSYAVRQTALDGPIRPRAIREVQAQHRNARFYICGPEGYVQAVHKGLRKAGVEPGRIHVELFALAASKGPTLTTRFKSYAAGAMLALLPLTLLLQPLQESRPHGHPNVGHADLQCVACHQDAPGTLRQTLQAKTKHALGLRQVGAVLGKEPVTSATCIQCHANPDDQHATNRFFEPRFDQARADIGPQLCVSCHREHSGVRVTVPSTGYCVSCHQDLKVKNDRTSPTHDYLIAQKQWGACMQCHDYHGNHKWTAPLKLQDAATLQSLQKYLQDGPSPYGATVVKAKQGAPS